MTDAQQFAVGDTVKVTWVDEGGSISWVGVVLPEHPDMSGVLTVKDLEGGAIYAPTNHPGLRSITPVNPGWVAG